MNTGSHRYTALGYASARLLSQIDGMIAPQGYDGNAPADITRDQIIGASRMLMRDNPIYRGVIGRCVTYVVGRGYAHQARTADPGWNRAAEHLWQEFWQSPEIRGTLSGKRYEALVFQELITTGDSFPVFVDDSGETKIQLFEAEQCIPAKSGFDNGVIVDEFGRPQAYNLVGYTNRGQVRRNKKNLIQRKNVIHLFEPERASSTRGMPVLQSAFPMLHRINDICDAEAIARQMLAHMALAITRENADVHAYSESKPAAGSEGFRVQEFEHGTVFHCAPGESIASVDRNIPGADFEKSMLLFLRVLGLPLGLPLEIVLLDWTKSNYSQSRAVLQQAFETFSYWQNLLKSRHLSRIYRRKLSEWVSHGKLPVRDDMAAHEWIAPSFPWLDEEKEIKAQAKKIELSLATHSEVCKAMQHDREEVVEARIEEIRDSVLRTRALEQELGVSIPWQLISGLPVTIANTIGASQQGEQTNADE